MYSTLWIVLLLSHPKKQDVVALSTAEAEYVILASCASQAIWLRRFIEKINHPQKGPTVIYCDNNSAISLTKNPVSHGRSKHIDIRFHFIRELVKNEDVMIEHYKSEEQVVDIFTKALKLNIFNKLKMKLGITSPKIQV